MNGLFRCGLPIIVSDDFHMSFRGPQNNVSSSDHWPRYESSTGRNLGRFQPLVPEPLMGHNSDHCFTLPIPPTRLACEPFAFWVSSSERLAWSHAPRLEAAGARRTMIGEPKPRIRGCVREAKFLVGHTQGLNPRDGAGLGCMWIPSAQSSRMCIWH